jgi:hypothetical protein
MTMNSASWRDIKGKWNNEPDLIELEEKGYHMFAKRHSTMGNLNGYVGVNINNPLFGVDYNKMDVEVHGGLTFSSLGGHVSVFKKNYWYFGFDTAHYMDLVPSMVAMNKAFEGLFEMESHDTYRDLNYVTNELNVLLEQIKQIVDRHPIYKVNHKGIYRKLHKLKKPIKRGNVKW